MMNKKDERVDTDTMAQGPKGRTVTMELSACTGAKELGTVVMRHLIEEVEEIGPGYICGILFSMAAHGKTEHLDVYERAALVQLYDMMAMLSHDREKPME